MALSKWQLLLSGDWGSAYNGRDDGTYSGPMLTALFVCQVCCLVLDYRENSCLRPGFGGWLPAGDLCGLWFGLVTESALSLSFPMTAAVWLLHSNQNLEQMCRPHGANSLVVLQAWQVLQEDRKFGSLSHGPSTIIQQLLLQMIEEWMKHINEEWSWDPT